MNKSPSKTMQDRNILTPIIIILALTLVANFLPTPVTVYWALFALVAIWLLWVVVTFFTNRRREDEYLTAVSSLLVFVFVVADELQFPSNWAIVPAVMLVLLAAWKVWITRKEQQAQDQHK